MRKRHGAFGVLFLAACGAVLAASSFLAADGTILATGSAFLAAFGLLAAGWFLLAAFRFFSTETKASSDKQRHCKDYEHLLHVFDSFELPIYQSVYNPMTI